MASFQYGAMYPLRIAERITVLSDPILRTILS